MIPSVRRVYLDEPARPKGSSSSLQTTQTEIARLNAENIALRTNCLEWRRRAEVHSAATSGLLKFTHALRNHAVKMHADAELLKMVCNGVHEQNQNA